MKGQRVSPTRPRMAALTLIEILVVIALIAILAVMLLPAIEKARARAKQAACMSNLHQIGIAFHTFKNEHEDILPTGVPVRAGGVKEVFATPLGGLRAGWEQNVFRIFQSLSNHLVSPRILICHADRAHRPATNFAGLQRENVSYFALVCLPGKCEHPDAVWAGDAWHLPTNSLPYASESMMAIQTWALHGGTRGNLLFADGRVEKVGRDGAGAGFFSIPEQTVKVPPGLNPPPPETTSTSPQTGSSSAGVASSGGASGGGRSGGGSSGGRSSSGSGGSSGSGSSSRSPGLFALLEQALGGQSKEPQPATRPTTIARSGPTTVAASPETFARSNNIDLITQQVQVAKAPLAQTNSETKLDEPILADAPVLARPTRTSLFLWLLLALLALAALLVARHVRRKHPVVPQTNPASSP